MSSFLLYVLGSIALLFLMSRRSKSAVLLRSKSPPMLEMAVILSDDAPLAAAPRCGVMMLDGWMESFCLVGALVSNSFLAAPTPTVREELLRSSVLALSLPGTALCVTALLWFRLSMSCSLKSSSPKKTCPLDRRSGDVEFEVVGDMVSEGDCTRERVPVMVPLLLLFRESIVWPVVPRLLPDAVDEEYTYRDHPIHRNSYIPTR